MNNYYSETGSALVFKQGKYQWLRIAQPMGWTKLGTFLAWKPKHSLLPKCSVTGQSQTKSHWSSYFIFYNLFKITQSYGSVNMKTSDRNSLLCDWSIALHDDITGKQTRNWSGNRTHCSSFRVAESASSPYLKSGDQRVFSENKRSWFSPQCLGVGIS